MTDFLIWGAVVVAVAGAGLPAWRRLHPVSFWWLLGFPIKTITVYGTWRAVASGCGLARKRRRWRFTFPGFPGLGG
ncbi:hypothetical protein [Streptosporangium sp. NPDC006007]|uniref:hypothetical protein n=1 Tax=Streptosporangium sp. NPDC006007 TaxID=3154575 RepID=UPI0033BA3975